MTTKTTARSPAPAQRSKGPQQGVPRVPAPLTTEGRLQAIEAIGKRIQGFVEFISKVGTMNGTSAEAKEKAVTAFHERLLVLERLLGEVQEDLRLG